MTKKSLSFKGSMKNWEVLAAIIYLPVHAFLLPIIMGMLIAAGYSDEANSNLIIYGIGVIYVLLVLGQFLRRDFDPLCDRPLNCLWQIFLSYIAMMAMNMCIAPILQLIMPAENPNNAAIVDMANIEFGKIFAMSVFLAPILEETIFRGCIFGFLHKYNRVAAYAASMLLFALYHVWSYAIIDPRYLVCILQYLPVTFLLCRLYEDTGSIWPPIFMHMLVNGISLKALMMLQELM